MTPISAERIALEHLCDLDVELEPPLFLPTATGTRLVYVTRAGRLVGDRLNGELLPGGADWLTLGSDGVGRLDVRAVLRLDDRALVSLTVNGTVALTDEQRTRFAAGEALGSDELAMRTQLNFETDPEGPHAWLNTLTTVAINELGPGSIGYRVFEVC